MDFNGAVIASSMYSEGELVGKDVEITLPEIVNQTADIQAMGTLSVPVQGMLENLQLTVKKIGIDINLAKINKMGKQNLEFRWIQQKVQSDGSIRNVGCRCYVRTLPNSSFPSIGIVNGSVSEAEGTYNVTRIQLFVDGIELYLIDRISGILRIGGVDYYQDVRSLL